MHGPKSDPLVRPLGVVSMWCLFLHFPIEYRFRIFSALASLEMPTASFAIFSTDILPSHSVRVDSGISHIQIIHVLSTLLGLYSLLISRYSMCFLIFFEGILCITRACMSCWSSFADQILWHLVSWCVIQRTIVWCFWSVLFVESATCYKSSFNMRFFILNNSDIFFLPSFAFRASMWASFSGRHCVSNAIIFTSSPNADKPAC